MGVYEDRVLPHLVQLTCGGSEMERWRARATDGLHGEVLEIGFGSGLNLPVYPDAVTKVWGVEPNLRAREMATERMAAAPFPVELVGLDGQAVPLPDGTCDGALATFTLCTIPDPALALDEVRRVLRPGGTLHLLEHGASPDPSVATWQRRFEPLQRKLAGGCHLTRDPVELAEAAGFTVEEVDRRYAKGPKPWSWFTVARVRAA